MANKYKRKAEPMNRWVALVMALISIFMGTVFSSMLYPNQPITREEATQIIGDFKEAEGYRKLKGGYTEVSLFFYDEQRQYISSCCVTDELLEALKKIPIGTEFKILVNPNNDYVVELIAEDVILLDFDYAQKALKNNSIGFFAFGIVMYIFAIIFIVQAVLDFKKKMKRAKVKKPKK